jgi:hypothetical protein
MRKIFIAIVGLFVFSSVNAAIIDGTGITISGSSYETFIDTNTGIEWVDTDSFFNQSFATVSSLISGSGVRYGSNAEAATLLSSFAGLAGSAWDAVWNIAVGSGRDSRIWSRALGETFWVWEGDASIQSDTTQGTSWNTNSYTYVDMGHYLVVGSNDGSVPAPAPIALLGLGLAAIGFVRKHKSS